MSELQTRTRGKRRIAILISVLVIALVAVWWFVHRSNTKAAADAAGRGGMAVAVGTATVEKHDVALELTALGTVNATYTVTVHSRVDGQLEKVHFTEGQMV